MATESRRNSDQSTDSHATMARAAIAAAATGAAVYGVTRLRTSHDEENEDQSGATTKNQQDTENDEARKANRKREGLSHALATKVADAKNAASKYTPTGRRHSTLTSAWEAAADHLLPVAKEAATSLGRTAAKKAPDLVRNELMPNFIHGFQEEAD